MLARMTATADLKLPMSVPMKVKTLPNIKQEAEIIRVDAQESRMDPIIHISMTKAYRWI